NSFKTLHERMTRISTFLVGESCRRNWIVDARFAGSSALNSWAAQQRRPSDGVKIFVMRPFPGWQLVKPQRLVGELFARGIGGKLSETSRRPRRRWRSVQS